MILNLSSTARLASWLQLDLQNADNKKLANDSVNLEESLECARERITLMVEESFQDVGAPLPASLHRACLMIAAKLFRRDGSIYGESYVVGSVGDVATLLSNDPDIRALLSPYMRAHVGDAVPTIPLPVSAVRNLEYFFGTPYPGRA